MAIDNPKLLFTWMLSGVRLHTENVSTIFEMLSEEAQHDEIKQALQARAFVAHKILSTVDKCFEMIGQQPMKISTRLFDTFLEDFRSQISEMQSPEARRLFVLAKAHEINGLRMGEYTALIEMADASGNYGLGVLLSACQADMWAFQERTRHLLRKLAEGKIEMKLTA